VFQVMGPSKANLKESKSQTEKGTMPVLRDLLYWGERKKPGTLVDCDREEAYHWRAWPWQRVDSKIPPTGIAFQCTSELESLHSVPGRSCQLTAHKINPLINPRVGEYFIDV
jgi:hypothetical protein